MADELKNALEKAAEEQPDGALSARVKKLLARKKNLQRKKRAKPVSYTHLTLPTKA